MHWYLPPPLRVEGVVALAVALLAALVATAAAAPVARLLGFA